MNQYYELPMDFVFFIFISLSLSLCAPLLCKMCHFTAASSEIDKHVFRVQIAGSMRKSAIEFYCFI